MPTVNAIRASSLPSREPSTAPMIATRSLLFNALFYLNMVVLMIVGLPTMLSAGAPCSRSPGCGAGFRSGFWTRSAVSGSNIAGSRTSRRRRPDRGQASIVSRNLCVAQIRARLRHHPQTPADLCSAVRPLSHRLAADRDRSRPWAAGAAANRRGGKAGVRRGRQVFIYPEGTRRFPAAPPKYKQGAPRSTPRGRRLPAGRGQHGALLETSRLLAPARRRRDRISARDRARARPRRLRPTPAIHNRSRLRPPQRERRPKTPRSRRFWPKAQRARKKLCVGLDIFLFCSTCVPNLSLVGGNMGPTCEVMPAEMIERSPGLTEQPRLPWLVPLSDQGDPGGASALPRLSAPRSPSDSVRAQAHPGADTSFPSIRPQTAQRFATPSCWRPYVTTPAVFGWCRCATRAPFPSRSSPEPNGNCGPSARPRVPSPPARDFSRGTRRDRRRPAHIAASPRLRGE